MQYIKISELKPFAQNDYYFDDITGDSWAQFLESIRTSGVIEPVIITQDKIIVSGHQRVRACKELGIEEVLTETRQYDSEDQILKELIETNIRQRGIGNPNPVKFGRCIKALEKVYGIHNGNQLSNNFKAEKTQSELAEEFGLTVQTLQNYKMLAEMIPEMEDLVLTGIVTPTTARAILKELSEDEQRELADEFASKGEKVSKREVDFYINRVKELTEENKTLKDTPPKEVEKIVPPEDYESTKETLKQTQKELRELTKDSDRYFNMYVEICDKYKASEEKSDRTIEKNMALNKKIEELEAENARLKSDTETFNSAAFLERNKTSVYRSLDGTEQLCDLGVKAQTFLENDLAPLKFRRCFERVPASDVARENLIETVNLIRKWTDEMYKVLDATDNEVIIDLD